MKKDYCEPEFKLVFFEDDVLVSSSDDPYGDDKDWGSTTL